MWSRKQPAYTGIDKPLFTMSKQELDQAACRPYEQPELWFAAEDSVEEEKALRICRGCPVRRECLTEAIEGDMRWGIWGGLKERQLHKLQAKHREQTA